MTMEIDVDIPLDWDDETTQFIIEENSCPGTGFVGSAFDKNREDLDKKNCCWACALQGENKIIDWKVLDKK